MESCRKPYTLRIIILVVLFLPLTSFSQVSDPYVEKVNGLVNYYQFMLNTIGSSNTPSMEKDIVIEESFQKVFRDSEVQIEDDLLLERVALVNKNVVAYLRDVDFFFKNIRFSFSDIVIEKMKTDAGGDFYLVKFISSWEGTSLEGESLSESKERYMEINLGDDGDLSIVSIYSTKISRDEALKNWWSDLGAEWKNYFIQTYFGELDSLSTADLNKLTQLDSLSLSGEDWLEDISSLTELRKLVYLDLSETGVSDLVPLRFSQNLRSLNLSQTNVEDLSVLEYLKRVQELNLSKSGVEDISFVENLENLIYLDLEATRIFDFEPLKAATKLSYLNLSGTSFNNGKLLADLTQIQRLELQNSYIVSLSGFDKLERLEYLNVASSYIKELSPLSGLESLKILNIENTAVSELTPLLNNSTLEKVSADNTNINTSAAQQFMQQKSGTIIITNSANLRSWWSNLSPEWQSVLVRDENSNITNERLVAMLQVDSLNVSGTDLLDGTPISRFTRLKKLNISKTGISDLSWTKSTPGLEILIANGNPIQNITNLSSLSSLKTLELNGSQVSSLYALKNLKNLETVKVDNTSIDADDARSVWNINPRVTVIHRTDDLSAWWNELTTEWQSVFQKEDNVDESLALHGIVQRTKLVISNPAISDLDPLNILVGLNSIELIGTQVMDVSSLYNHKNLKSLRVSNSPFSDLSSVSNLFMLLELNISNTAVSSLGPLLGLKNLKKLDCSGTQIKNIKELRSLKNLESLNISNTSAWQLQWLLEHPDFKELICYNSRVNDRKIAEFKKRFPECEVTYY